MTRGAGSGRVAMSEGARFEILQPIRMQGTRISVAAQLSSSTPAPLVIHCSSSRSCRCRRRRNCHCCRSRSRWSAEAIHDAAQQHPHSEESSSASGPAIDPAVQTSAETREKQDAPRCDCWEAWLLSSGSPRRDAFAIARWVRPWERLVEPNMCWTSVRVRQTRARAPARCYTHRNASIQDRLDSRTDGACQRGPLLSTTAQHRVCCRAQSSPRPASLTIPHAGHSGRDSALDCSSATASQPDAHAQCHGSPMAHAALRTQRAAHTDAHNIARNTVRCCTRHCAVGETAPPTAEAPGSPTARLRCCLLLHPESPSTALLELRGSDAAVKC